MTEPAVHEYPSKYGRGHDPDLDEAWDILDTVKPGVISTETRAWLAGLITGVLKRRTAEAAWRNMRPPTNGEDHEVHEQA